MSDLIKQAAVDLAGSDNVVVLTGAGISVESGIPPFRGKGGVWERVDPMEYATIDAFMRDPGRVWDVLVREMKNCIDRSRPNDAHYGLATLEKMGIVKTVITQNVDGLHQAAGSTDVIEFHGNFAWLRCMECGQREETRKIAMAEIPPRCSCGGILRPEVIFFGEQIPTAALMRSEQIASRCDIMLVVGTSAVVQPAAYMPVVAKNSGARVIEINPERTPLTASTSDYLVQGKAGKVMRKLVEEIERLR